MADFDLASLLADSNMGAGIFNDLAVSIQTNSRAQEDITNVMVQQANEAKSAAENIAMVQGQAKLVTQDANLKIANTMGTNASSSGWLIGEMGKRVIEADKAAQAKLADVQAKRSIDFIDNPLGYLYAQATVDGDIDEYNSYLAASDLAKETASKLEQMSQSAFVTQNAIEQSVTESSIASGKIIAGFKYGQEAQQAALQGLRTNLDGMRASALATKEAINFKFDGANAIRQEKQYQLSLASHALARENFNLSKQAFAEKQSEDSLIAKYIQKGFFNASGQEMDGARAKEMIALFKSGEPRIRDLFNSGMESYMISADGKQSVISTSPFTASNMFAKGQVQNLPESQKQVGEWLVDKRRQFENPAIQNQLGIDPKDAKGKEAAFNAFIKSEATKASIVGADIYAPASLATVVSANANLAALPVWKNVLAPMAATGTKLDNPALVMGAVQAAVMKGTLSYNDALDTVTLYQSAVDMNNMSRNWISTGMPKGIAYQTKVPSYGSFGKANINVLDKNQFATWLNKSSAATAAIEMRKKMMSNLPGTGVQ